jgi:hypothetical protein
MELFNISTHTELWTTPVSKHLTSTQEEELIITSMANQLYCLNRKHIYNMICKLVDSEFSKKDHLDLRKRLLIKNQIYNNAIHNIWNIVFNLSKETYDREIANTQTQQFDDMKTDESVNILNFNC